MNALNSKRLNIDSDGTTITHIDAWFLLAALAPTTLVGIAQNIYLCTDTVLIGGSVVIVSSSRHQFSLQLFQHSPPLLSFSHPALNLLAALLCAAARGQTSVLFPRLCTLFFFF